MLNLIISLLGVVMQDPTITAEILKRDLESRDITLSLIHLLSNEEGLTPDENIRLMQLLQAKKDRAEERAVSMENNSDVLSASDEQFEGGFDNYDADDIPNENTQPPRTPPQHPTLAVSVKKATDGKAVEIKRELNAHQQGLGKSRSPVTRVYREASTQVMFTPRRTKMRVTTMVTAEFEKVSQGQFAPQDSATDSSNPNAPK